MRSYLGHFFGHTQRVIPLYHGPDQLRHGGLQNRNARFDSWVPRSAGVAARRRLYFWYEDRCLDP
jgi:hypothetical protein